MLAKKKHLWHCQHSCNGMQVTDLNKYGLRLTQLQVKQTSRHLTLSVVTMTSQ